MGLAGWSGGHQSYSRRFEARLGERSVLVGRVGKGGTYLFFFVPLFTEVFTPSGHFGSAHSVFFGCEMFLRLRLWKERHR